MTTVKQVYDLRLGGLYNILCVDVDNKRQFWVVQYDQWRDDNWNVEKAYSTIQLGCRHETPVVFTIDRRAFEFMTELMTNNCCDLCVNEANDWKRKYPCCMTGCTPEQNNKPCNGFKAKS